MTTTHSVIEDANLPLLQQPGFRSHHILTVAKRNARNRYFIPSSDNLIGNLVYNTVFIDSGYNSLLLPIFDQSELRNVLLKEYPPGPVYRWGISTGRGGASHLILTITKPLPQHHHQAGFEIRLGRDLGGRSGRVDSLRFLLTRCDLDYLWRFKNQCFKDCFCEKDVRLIQNARSAAPPAVRRKQAVIGQSLLSRGQSWNQRDYLLLWEEDYDLTADFLTWWHQSSDGLEQLDLWTNGTQPLDFDSLESEDSRGYEINYDGTGDNGDSGDEI